MDEFQRVNPLTLGMYKQTMDKIDLQPDFQRGEVWNKERKMKLVDSILRKKYIPEILLADAKSDDFEQIVIDGQQRLSTIRDFFRGIITVKDGTVIEGFEIGGMTYDELPEELQERFKSYALSVTKINGDEATVRDMFLRLQGGMALNKAEVRGSKLGRIQPLVKEMLNHPFFSDSVGVVPSKNKRKKFDEVCEQLILIQLRGITTVKNTNIENMYDEFNESGIPEKYKEELMIKLDFLNNAFGKRSQTILANKTNIINAFVVLTEFMGKEADYNRHIDEFGKWFRNFEGERKHQNDNRKSNKPVDPLYQKYFDAMAAGTASADSIRARKNVLYESWMKWLDEVKEHGSSGSSENEPRPAMNASANDNVLNFNASMYV